MNFDTNTVTQGYEAGVWHYEEPETNTWITESGIDFALKFFLDDNEFVMYSNDSSYQYKYGYQFDTSEILYVEVLGDVEYMTEISFHYNKTN